MPEDKNWKSSYESYNKVTVDVVGWSDEEAGSRLSFWVATGVNPGRACSYSLTNNDRSPSRGGHRAKTDFSSCEDRYVPMALHGIHAQS